eukprot:CAMPEP_0178947894 /NCGR_PEP_ID=MMETSP0789-20121207/5159_1 /TAXON_ID=3005 /ORGANISM="Rhizosolenia setigera, Strain CCMP 1694" /LENGTH=313 /DNA_ID=CAMNT_0020628177 /DNA_START=1 /DNA_END=942 /DNA_ORIENTATION=-
MIENSSGESTTKAKETALDKTASAGAAAAITSTSTSNENEKPTPATNNNTNTNNAKDDDEDDDDEDLLVSEFPPPPFYYKSYASLKPPKIPSQKLKEYSEKAAFIVKDAVRVMEAKYEEKKSAEDEVENKNLIKSTENKKNNKNTETNTTNEEDKGETSSSVVKMDEEKLKQIHEQLQKNITTVFGDVIIEDPIHVSVPDDCSEPQRVQKKIKQLNRKVVNSYIKLVGELVHDNDAFSNNIKKCRDELSHNVLLMLHEANKFREHQAREILIGVLETQLKQRKEALEMLKKEIQDGKLALDKMKEVCVEKMEE